MPVFNWEAVTKEGARRSGEMDMPAKQLVLQELERQKLLPVKVEEKKAVKGGKKGKAKGKIKTIDKILMCQHVAVMIRAGIALNPALDILVSDAETEAIRAFYKDVQERVRRGESLWQAFAAHQEVLPQYVIGLIRAGEASGQLADAFDQASEQLKREYESKRKAIAAMFYPAILVFMSIMLLLFLFLFAVPRLAEALGSVAPELPLFTRIVFGTSKFLSSNPLLVALGLFLFFGGIIFFAASKQGRKLIAILAWKIPFIRTFLKKFAVARLARTLGALLNSGLPAVEAMEITAYSVGVTRFQELLLETRDRVRRGASFADAFRAYPEDFPHLLTGMIAVGEQSGQLSSLLLTVSKFFEEDADRALQTLVGLIEPIMLLGMGLIVGGIAISVILPIYQLVTLVG
jgi:type II secretory pathway component PulF